MNRDETKSLLTRRLDLTGDSFNAGMLESWADMLDDVPYGDAVVAMRRAATKHGHVRWFDFKAELDAHQHDKRDRHAEAEEFDCALCGGTGWKDAGTDRAGNSSVEPCTLHVRPGKVIPPSQGLAIAAAGVEDEMRARGRASYEIDQVINRWFGTDANEGAA